VAARRRGASGEAFSWWMGACQLARAGTTGWWINVRKQVVAGYILELTRVRMGGDDTAGAGGGCGVSTAVIDRGWVAHAASIV
jgi:hypothetical protein